jgi:16S rRNA (uracil1498-N3)-methyltransferase
MDYFYAPPDKIGDGIAVIEGDELSHLVHVMRKKAGDEIVVVDGAGLAYRVVLESVSKRSARGAIQDSHRWYHEPASSVTIAVGILKNPSRFDFLVEKVSEIGASEIVPLTTERTIPSHAKTERWQKLALSAMKQCGRSYLPKVKELASLDEVIGSSGSFKRKLIGHAEGEPFAQAASKDTTSTLILVGPEGGFSDEEVARCVAAGFKSVSLGERRLRTETAAIAFASLLILGSPR